MSKVFEDNFTKSLPVGTKVRLIKPEPSELFMDVFMDEGNERDREYVGEVFRVAHSAEEIDGQTHQLELRIDGHLWWVYDNQIEVLDYEEEK